MYIENSTVFTKKTGPNEPPRIPQTARVRFANRIVLVNPYYVMGGTRWSRFIYKMRNFPLMAIKMGVQQMYRRIRRFFIKDRVFKLGRGKKT